MSTKASSEILSSIRALMQNKKFVSTPLDAYIVPTADAHNSEYVADCDKRRQYISGFTGSAGTAVVTASKAALWTDGRYHTQAERELDATCWTLMKDGLPATPTIADWLVSQLPSAGGAIGLDPRLYSSAQWEALESKLHSFHHTLVASEHNLVDEVWHERPPRPNTALRLLEARFAGVGWPEKVKQVCEKLEATEVKADAIVVTALDDIAWLLNMRAQDIDYNPVFFAYVVIKHQSLSPQKTPEILIYIDPTRVLGVATVSEWLGLAAGASSGEKDGVRVHVRPYDAISADLPALAASDAAKRVALATGASEWVARMIPKEKRVPLDATPIAKAKATKNEAEVRGMRHAHVMDGVALAALFEWLERELNAQSPPTITEMDVSAKLDEIKAAQFGAEFVSPSFASIAASGPNAAVIHYHPQASTNRALSLSEPFLLDCGSQYPYGTTDVTRTVWLSTGGAAPPERVRHAFTLVLKGHIQLARTVFPDKLKGHMLDTLARTALWRVGLDYMHGTGHGVGSFLNVHEGPCGILPRERPGEIGLGENMILSNEPGYYEPATPEKPDGFGIRIESLVRVASTVPMPVELPAGAVFKPRYFPFPREFEPTTTTAASPDAAGKTADAKPFLSFETITLCPIDTRLVAPALLSSDERDWLDEYHALVRRTLEPELRTRGLLAALEWLVRRTAPLA